MFRDISSLQTKTLQEVYREISKNISICFTNDFGLNDIFPAMNKKELDFQGNRFGYNFFLEEIIKNAFVHGYNGFLDQPIGIAIKLNDKQEVQEISTYTKNIKNLDANPIRMRELENVRLNGYGLGQQYMNLSYLRSYEEIPEFSDGKFFKVKSVLYDKIDEQKKYEFDGFTERMFLAHRRGLIILPENMEVVNTMLQQGKKALNIAWKVATMEADESFAKDEQENYTFIQRHQSQAGKQGATELINFIEKMKARTRWLNKIAPKLAYTIVRKSSIVKHVIIDYRTIKASGIKQAIELFGTNARLTQDGQVSIAIVEDIEEIKDSFTLINTGIKINGSSIYRIANSDLLMYGAKGQTSVKVAQALDGTKEIKQALKEMGIEGEIGADTDSVIRKQGQGIELNQGILEIGETELKGKTPEQITRFIRSALEVKRAIGIMYGQKTIIDLKSLQTTSALIKAVRARKVITEEQYKELQLSKEKILEIKEKGIEIYIASNRINEEYRQNGISGQIIRDSETNKAYIYDYYSMDKTEIDEITNQEDLGNLEDKIVNGDNLIMIDIELLKKNFQGSNIIESFTKLGALTGKIKMTMGLGNIGIRDIENIGYNIRFDKIPELTIQEAKELSQIFDSYKILDVIGRDSEFGIILRSIKEKAVLERFIEIIKERILSKSKLIENGNEIEGIELKDKKMEKMLGELLLRAEKNKYKELSKEEINQLMKDITPKNTIEEIMKSIKELKKIDEQEKGKDKSEQEMLVNKMILLILYSEKKNGKQIQEQIAINNISTYRAMLAAA